MGNTQRSVQLSEEAYELSLQHFGRSHPLTLTALSNLGVLLFNSGDRERGVQLIRQVWENHRDSLGDQHPDTIHCLSNLALMLHRVERTVEALPLRVRRLSASVTSRYRVMTSTNTLFSNQPGDHPGWIGRK